MAEPASKPIELLVKELQQLNIKFQPDNGSNPIDEAIEKLEAFQSMLDQGIRVYAWKFSNDNVISNTLCEESQRNALLIIDDGIKLT